MTDPRAIKRYFASPGTVATWWHEDQWHPVLKQYFDEQVRYVCSIDDWRGKSVLDAGTGFGRFASALASVGAKIGGLDISMDMLALARDQQRRSGRRIDWQCGDVEHLPFRDESFDAAICMETLMHVPEPCAATRELARVVRPRGLVVIGINNRWSLPGLVHALHVHLALYRRLTGRATVYRHNSMAELQSWLRSANLELLDVVGIGLLHPAVHLKFLSDFQLRLVPYWLAERCLSLENRCNLGHTWLQHIMKALVVSARKGG